MTLPKPAIAPVTKTVLVDPAGGLPPPPELPPLLEEPPLPPPPQPATSSASAAACNNLPLNRFISHLEWLVLIGWKARTCGPRFTPEPRSVLELGPLGQD